MANETKISPDLLKLVQRPAFDEKGKPLTETKRGKEVPVMRAIEPEEVLAFREYSDRVVVVTEDGQKFEAPKPKK